MKKYIIFTLCFIASNICSGQFKATHEIGFQSGLMYYLGDLNKCKDCFQGGHFSESSPFISINYKENVDKRISYRANILMGQIKGDDRVENRDSISRERGLHFKSKLYEISGKIEFNFLPFELGNPMYKWTPFLFSGLSMFYFNPQAENYNGEWVDLQPLSTEGQETTSFPERQRYRLSQFAIPIGGGLKFSLSKFSNFIIEYSARKTFTDYLDDVSKTYPGENVLRPEFGNESVYMSDPTGNFKAGDQRGNSERNDWYSYIGITVSFKINNNNSKCNYE
tara:strand:+ start:425 stop:1264 length:840 start_codon:yes stop_codon:yes gene_type:complete